MSDYLPYDNFSWVKFIEEKNEKGYILEVDLEYPTEIHELHNDFPFYAENICPPNSKTSKLIPNLNNKTNKTKTKTMLSIIEY
jgi:hypothetical protein